MKTVVETVKVTTTTRYDLLVIDHASRRLKRIALGATVIAALGPIVRGLAIL
jgi:hypothetical protein